MPAFCLQGAWNQSNTGRQDIIIAVTDSGAQLDHPDLQGAFWINPGEIPGNGIDDDGNGEDLDRWLCASTHWASMQQKWQQRHVTQRHVLLLSHACFQVYPSRTWVETYSTSTLVTSPCSTRCTTHCICTKPSTFMMQCMQVLLTT